MEKPNPSPLRIRRHEMGLTLEAMAARIGTHKAYLSDIETGRKTPSLKMLGKLCHETGLRPETIAPQLVPAEAAA